MATATARAEDGAEIARMEGRGPGGEAAEAAKNAVTGRDEPVIDRPGVGTGVGSNGSAIDRGLVGPRYREGLLGRTEEELARLRTRTTITHEGEAYCPNPNIRDLPKEFETRVTVIQRYPEMRTIEKTDFVKEIYQEERTIIVPKTRVIMDEVEHIDRVPVVRQVPQTRIEVFHRVITEEREVTDMVPVVEYLEVPRIEQVPRVITEDMEERITVPVVREVPVTRMVEVPTGNYCEAPAGEFINPGHFNLLGHRSHKSRGLTGLLHRTKSSSSASSSDNEKAANVPAVDAAPTVLHNPDGTTTTTTSLTGSRRKSLLQRILH